MSDTLALARVGLGICMVAVGGVGVLYPDKVAKFEEILDAVGSQRRLDTVEPAGWNVALTRVASGFVVLIGLWWVLLGIGEL